MHFAVAFVLGRLLASFGGCHPLQVPSLSLQAAADCRLLVAMDPFPILNGHHGP